MDKLATTSEQPISDVDTPFEGPKIQTPPHGMLKNCHKHIAGRVEDRGWGGVQNTKCKCASSVAFLLQFSPHSVFWRAGGGGSRSAAREHAHLCQPDNSQGSYRPGIQCHVALTHLTTVPVRADGSSAGLSIFLWGIEAAFLSGEGGGWGRLLFIDGSCPCAIGTPQPSLKPVRSSMVTAGFKTGSERKGGVPGSLKILLRSPRPRGLARWKVFPCTKKSPHLKIFS